MTYQNKMKDYPLNNTIVKVFPDHMSTGLWIDHANVDERSFNFNSTLVTALKYWHLTWEMLIGDLGGNRMSESFIQQWNEDGAELVAAMNHSVSNNGLPYTFEYKATWL